MLSTSGISKETLIRYICYKFIVFVVSICVFLRIYKLFIIYIIKTQLLFVCLFVCLDCIKEKEE